MRIDGNHIIYHYLQKHLQKADVRLFRSLVARLIGSLGIWFSPRIYASLPVLLPHVIRDPSCRPRRRGEPDEWGVPDGDGYCRDDNSLVKGLPRSLYVRSSRNPLYNGRQVGNGFVASHVWRSVDTGRRAAKLGWTNTFIPNLVWLPTQVAKLTDRAGSFTQAYLQALSYKLYRRAAFPTALQPWVEAGWRYLARPAGFSEEDLPSPEDLSFFEESDRFVKKRLSVVTRTRDGLLSLVDSDLILLKPSSYSKGLKRRDLQKTRPLGHRLSLYLSAIGNVHPIVRDAG
jgi:hypothetical protein